MNDLPKTDTTAPSRTASHADLRRWRQYLADERAEAAVYRDLAGRRTGEKREILLAPALAEAVTRHERHWLDMLGDNVGKPRRGSLRTRFVGPLARHFGSVFVLTLAQRAEARPPYPRDVHATDTGPVDPRGASSGRRQARMQEAMPSSVLAGNSLKWRRLPKITSRRTSSVQAAPRTSSAALMGASATRFRVHRGLILPSSVLSR